QGDPASALLEVLDPEQNVGFIDHYVDLPFDLSKVLFICTANTMSTIPAPLLDRMEVIELPGYTLEEKEDIAVRYVLPKEIEAAGLKPNQVRVDRAALRRIMIDYAREPGLRTLQQLIGRIARKAAAKFVRLTEDGKVRPGDFKRLAVVIRKDGLFEWLGPKRFYNETAERITAPGVVVGLAWTAAGGDILFIEASDIPGDGALKLTGQMGDVMSESAAIAWSYVKRKTSREFAMDKEFFKGREYHLHIPSGAIPKDGPSAGITMATALYSLLSGRKSFQRVAMTGELSLVGKVLPVGGVKEKLLAARRAGIETVLLPKLNEKDLHDLPAYARKDLKIHFVSHVDEVFDLVLEKAGQSLAHPATGKTRAKVLNVKRRKPIRLKSKRSSRSTNLSS
ncbi:MAG: S16 family serine protease, partial [Bdellovibrionota bacterium]